MKEGKLVSAGGRVVDAIGTGESLEAALGAARAVASMVRLEGSTWRRDIGARGSLETAARRSLLAHAGLRAEAAAKTRSREPSVTPSSARQEGRRVSPSAYAGAGVDIDAGNKAVELMKAAVVSTYGPEVIAGIGSFGGLFDATALKDMERPVLVASTDGVGTKTSLGVSLGRYRGLGRDMVNHSIDDILVQGARPLFFLDYVAASRLVPEAVAEIVGGMAEACREAGCALLGGETAEMPGTYRDGEIDIAGTIVGVVEGGRALPRRDLAAGDLLVGLASSGLHTNGFSLARRIFEGSDLEAFQPRLGESLADCLLRPHRSYLGALSKCLAASPSPIKALAHITGGGFVENIPRILPPGLDALVRRDSWPLPPVFELIRARGGVSEAEMARVFNLGIGMVAVVAPRDLESFASLVGEETWTIGELAAGTGKAVLV
jgi:phosphoribosylaminoimidazole synthetase